MKPNSKKAIIIKKSFVIHTIIDINMKKKPFVPCCTPIDKESYNKMLPFLLDAGNKRFSKMIDFEKNPYLANKSSIGDIELIGCSGIDHTVVSNFQFLINSGVELTLQDVYIDSKEFTPYEEDLFHKLVGKNNLNYHYRNGNIFLSKGSYKSLIGYDPVVDNKIQATILEIQKYFGKEEKPKNGWYKSPKSRSYLMYHDFEKELYYGFNEYGWFYNESKKAMYLEESFVLSTDEEAEQRLKEEAVKRGFKEGVIVRNHQRGDRELINFSLENIKYSEKYHIGIYLTTGTGTWLMMDGIWAEIVEEPKDLPIGAQWHKTDDITNFTIQGKKETTNKTKYELDFDFIEAMAKRIESETKYPPYNWQLPIDTQDLADALFRHAVEVKKGNFDDDGELGHLMAIANNAMFLYYQKKHHSNELGE